jgi:putative transposase
LLLQLYPNFSVGFFCGLFGKSRQAYYEQFNLKNDRQLEEIIVLKLVAEIRAEMPRIGTKKIHYMLCEKLEEHCIKMGRDRLYTLLGEHGYLLRYRRRKPYTTDSNHPYYKYPNLIKDLVLYRANQLWVSDITYIRLISKFAYLSIITDAYSRKIVGYSLFPTLHSEGVIDAFNMTNIRRLGFLNLIHHSDRGVQYCSASYVELLTLNKIKISMTENGDPYENAIAERVNGILKTEFALCKTFQNFDEAKQAVDEAIRKYNELRPHASCDYMTPAVAHQKNGLLQKRWTKKMITLGVELR